MIAMTNVDAIWFQLTHVTAVPSYGMVVGSFFLAAFLVNERRTWYWVKYFITIVHESCHATSAYVFGGSRPRIKVRFDSSGETAWSARSKIGRVVTAFAGYTGVALVSVGSATLLGSGRIMALIFLTTVVAIMALISARNLLAAVILVGILASTLALSRCTAVSVQLLIPMTITWILSMGAIKDVHILSQCEGESDATILHGLTGVPARAWVSVFYAFTFACAAYGIWIFASRAW